MHIKTVGISGTRHTQKITGAQSGALCGILGVSYSQNLQVLTGCCPSGIDKRVRASCNARKINHAVFSVTGQRIPAALRARTLSMVAHSHILFAFPASANFAHSGTWLATFAAASQAKSVFVCMPSPCAPASSLPCCKGIVSWAPVIGSALPAPFNLLGSKFSFFAPRVSSTQVSIFNQ